MIFYYLHFPHSISVHRTVNSFLRQYVQPREVFRATDNWEEISEKFPMKKNRPEETKPLPAGRIITFRFRLPIYKVYGYFFLLILSVSYSFSIAATRSGKLPMIVVTPASIIFRISSSSLTVQQLMSTPFSRISFVSSGVQLVNLG